MSFQLTPLERRDSILIYPHLKLEILNWGGALVLGFGQLETTLFSIQTKNEIIPYELQDFPTRTFYQKCW